VAQRFTSSLYLTPPRMCGRANFIAKDMMGRLSCTEPLIGRTLRMEGAFLKAPALLRLEQVLLENFHFPGGNPISPASFTFSIISGIREYAENTGFRAAVIA
jgi:hypothetical protein